MLYFLAIGANFFVADYYQYIFFKKAGQLGLLNSLEGQAQGTAPTEWPEKAGQLGLLNSLEGQAQGTAPMEWSKKGKEKITQSLLYAF